MGVRRWRWIASTAVVGLALGACAGADEADPEPDQAAEDAAETDDDGETSEPQAGGELTIAVGAEPQSLNPTLQTTRATQRMAWPMLEFLVEVEDFEPATSGLVTDWEQVEDTRWRFTTREDVTFHNGEAFDAEAAVFSILDTRDSAAGVLAAYFAPVVADATVVDETTFEVETTTPTAGLPELLALVTAFPPEHLEEVGHETFGQEPVGTGPFAFDEWASGEHVVMSRYDDYWGGPADLETLRWVWTADSSQRVALLQTGSVDIAVNVPPGMVADVDAADGVSISQEPGLRKLFVAMNMTEPPFDDVRARQAVAHAIDRELLTESVFEGGATPSRSILSEAHDSAGGHDDFLEYDPDRAAELLDEVDGERSFPFHFTQGNYLLDSEVGEAVSGMLDAVGFEVEREPMETGAFFDLVYTQEMPGMHLLGQTPLYPHEDLTVRTWFTETALSRYCADEFVTEQAPQAFAAEGQERTELYNEIERYVLTEQVCIVPLYNQDEIYGVSDRVSGFDPRLDELIDVRTLAVQD